MRKKLLVIKGSSRKGSYTNKLLKDVTENMPEVDIVEFNTFSEKFAFCNGCNFCEENGKCVHRDLDGFFKDFETADVIIFASPVYNGSFSAPLKALVDRFQAYYTSFYKNNKTQPITKRRKCILLAAAGRNGDVALTDMEKNLKCAFTILNAELVGSVLCANTDTTPDCQRALNELQKLLRRSLADE